MKKTNAFIRFIKVIKNLRDAIKINKIYMKDGKYNVSSHFTKISRKDSFSNLKTFSDLNEKSAKRNYFKRMAFYLQNIFNIKIKSTTKKFYGDMLIISSSNEQYKIFDFEKKQVLTKYKEYSKYEKYKDNYNYLSRIYSIPEVTSFDDNDFVVIENYIKQEQSNINNEKIIMDIVNLYIQNSGSFVKKSEELKLCDRMDNFNIYGKLHNIYNNNKFTLIKCHGDLWQPNLICSSEKNYYIDFECVDYYSFFYDIFFYIFSSAYIMKDYTLVENFAAGKYDEKFSELFKLYGFSFEGEKRANYFCSFLFEYINKKWKNIDDDNLEKQFNKLEQFIEKLGWKEFINE